MAARRTVQTSRAFLLRLLRAGNNIFLRSREIQQIYSNGIHHRFNFVDAPKAQHVVASRTFQPFSFPTL